MTEYIGSRISLLSKSDIRYVGTLHEISSETSTVALENVRSYGTEGRRQNPADEIAPADTIYEYIVFRGSDVKDLRIEEGPAARENKPPPQMPDDPAIVGSSSRPGAPPQADPPQIQQGQPQPNDGPSNQYPPQGFQQPPPYMQQGRGQFPGQPPFPPYPPPGRGFGRGMPPGPGFPGMPYGPPPGWYPPFPQQQMPPGYPGQPPFGNQKPGPIGGPAESAQEPKSLSTQASDKGGSHSKSISNAGTPVPPDATAKPPAPPLESKPSVGTALAPPNPQVSAANSASPAELPTNKAKSAGAKGGKIVPAIPFASPKPQVAATATATKTNGHANRSKAEGNISSSQLGANAAIDNATQAATAAVAAAMAKLGSTPSQPKSQSNGGVDNLTARVNEMRVNDRGRRGHGEGRRGGRRGGGGHQQSRKIELPQEDYDFESANAKFNKQELAMEAKASDSPVEAAAAGENGPSGSTASQQDEDPVNVPPPAAVSYNRSSSFFDDISSESKDRDEKKIGGREWRGQEIQKNVETFGQGSVDNGHRGGYRGRGRGRGFGHRGRGGFSGRGGGRGRRGPSQAETETGA